MQLPRHHFVVDVNYLFFNFVILKMRTYKKKTPITFVSSVFMELAAKTKKRGIVNKESLRSVIRLI